LPPLFADFLNPSKTKLALTFATAAAVLQPEYACTQRAPTLITEHCDVCGVERLRRRNGTFPAGTLDRNCCNKKGSWHKTCGSAQAVRDGAANHTYISGYLVCNAKANTSSNENWDTGIQAELDYWDDWMASRGGDKFHDDYERRMSPLTPLRPLLQALLLKARRPNQTHFRMLDVGSGPMEASGFRMTSEPGLTLEVVATDALGDAYQKLLDKHGLQPPVRVLQLLGEQLTQRLAKDSFDLVMSVNALDHTQDPIAVLRQMLHVAKPGSPVFIRVYPNEAINGGYTGFHRWNFANVEGRLILHSKYIRRQIDVRKELGDLVRSVHCDHGSSAREAFAPGASAIVAKRHLCEPTARAKAAAARVRERICGAATVSRAPNYMYTYLTIHTRTHALTYRYNIHLFTATSTVGSCLSPQRLCNSGRSRPKHTRTYMYIYI